MLGPYQPYFRMTSFLMGSLEREQWLNLEGLYAYWFQASLAWYPGTRTGEYAILGEPASELEHGPPLVFAQNVRGAGRE